MVVAVLNPLVCEADSHLLQLATGAENRVKVDTSRSTHSPPFFVSIASKALR